MSKSTYCSAAFAIRTCTRVAMNGTTRFILACPVMRLSGRVTKVGGSVTKFKPGDHVAVGCMVDSCRSCPNCQAGQEQYCLSIPVYTYNGKDKIWAARLLAGTPQALSSMRPSCFAFPRGLILPRPRRCFAQGLRPILHCGTGRWNPTKKWGSSDLGGLGHMGVKFARAFGAQVVLFTTSPGKAADGLRLGAHEIVISKNQDEMKKHLGSFDFILDSVSADHDINAYLKLLKLDGTLALWAHRNARCLSPLLA